MKEQNQVIRKAILLLLLTLVSQIFSQGITSQNIVHQGTTFPKVHTLDDGDIVVLSYTKNSRESKLSVLDLNGNPEFGNVTLDNIYYSSSAGISQMKGDPEHKFFLKYHENQEKDRASQSEYTLTFNDKGKNLTKVEKTPNYDIQTSVYALKNGLIFNAGVTKASGDKGLKTVNVFLNDPKTNRNFGGQSFTTPAEYISCYEQKANTVYCVYVSYEDAFVSKMKLRVYSVNNNTLTLAAEQVIKTFYTEFNFLKAVPVNENEGAILFQTGKALTELNPPYGETGKDLFYYLINTNFATGELTVKRYDYLFNDCIYQKDPEYYNADIAVLTQNKIYVVCETTENIFKGMLITPKSKEVTYFNFNNFDVNTVQYPVFTKFGQSMGLFYVINKETVVYQIMNYPDCSNYKDTNILIPVHFYEEIDLTGRIFITNPYPASRLEQKMFYRLKKPKNLILMDAKTTDNLLDNTNYETSTVIKIVANESSGIQAVQFTSAYVDTADGLVTGKTCNVNINTPKCLDQCESCTKEGDKSHHYCLGCKERHFSEEDPSLAKEKFGKPHYCHRCNIACFSCFGNATNVTTNCNKCDYDNGYYHLELDERTCLNNQTAEQYEKEHQVGLWLDQPDPVDKTQWRWRVCHKHCKKCRSKGDDNNNQCTVCIEGYHFYYNQSFDNDTIPGSCITDCENNGFYVNETDDKCHPCLDHCKNCKNKTICEKCYPNFFLMPDRKECVDKCPDCLAYDHDLGECVYCKTRYEFTAESPRYNLNQTCVYPMPEGYHLIDDICYKIIICGEGCFTCDPWNSTKCTQCFPEFYKEHFKGVYPHTFGCFTYDQCGRKVGGAPIIRDRAGLCLNCKLENGTYRYPIPAQKHDEGKAPNYICVNERKSMTYIDIPDYNTLAWCYIRCKSCDSYGIPDKMNCKTCRDDSIYKIFNAYTKEQRYNVTEINAGIGDCIKNPPPCGACPYYHKYNEEGDGEDICLCKKVGTTCTTECGVCPEEYPYYMIETRECVETCGFEKLLAGLCSMTNTMAAFSMFANPFNMKDTTSSLNLTETIATIISMTFIQNYFNTYQISRNQVTNIVTNIFGSGTYFNLPAPQIIVGNNITIEFTTLELELEKLAKLLKGETVTTTTTKTTNSSYTTSTPTSTTTSTNSTSETTVTTTTTSIVNIAACEKILKQIYNISEAENLVIVKGDFLRYLSEYFINQVEYQIFSTSLGKFLDLCHCQNANVTSTIINPFDSLGLTSPSLQLQFKQTIEQGYDSLDYKSSFFNDICTPFTNENGNDVLLVDRQADYYFNNNINPCKSGCTYDGYNSVTKMFTCICPIEGGTPNITKFNNTEFVPASSLPASFTKKSKNSNIEVFKCSSQVFSAKGQKKNFGSYILLVSMASFIATFVYYVMKGSELMNAAFSKLTSKAPAANPPKLGENVGPEKEKKENEKEKNQRELGYDNILENKDVSKVQKVEVLYDIEVNSLPFGQAKLKDQRPWYKIYWSYLKNKQIILFSFVSKEDYQVRVVKIALFILFVAFYFAFTALFFNDDIMRQIYKYKGNTDAAIHVPNIILSSICCLIMGLIVRFVSLSERDISKLNQENNDVKVGKTIKILKIKVLALYAIAFGLIFLCWYYVSAFCAVFKNSQGHYLLNVFISFIVCNLWPCVLCLIPSILRRKALDTDNESLYKASQIIAYF